MAFGAELKDFVSGFKTGYDMIDSPDNIAYKKKQREWAAEDRDIAADNRRYARGRDTVSDAHWDYNKNHGEEREGRNDAQWDTEHMDRVRAANIEEEKLRQAKEDKERLSTGNAPVVTPLPDPNSTNSTPAPAPASTPGPGADASSGHGTQNLAYNAAIPDGVDSTTTGSVTPAAYTAGDPTANLSGPAAAAKMVKDLQRDYGMPQHVAIGIAGALAGESGGFTQMQELKPTVPGSRGGAGYAQWTGPRRNQFEAYGDTDNIGSYDKNYGFLRHELDNTSEGNVLHKLAGAKTAEQAQRLFTDNFLRPGIPNYEGRDNWTRRVAGLFGDGAGTRHLARGGMIEPKDYGAGTLQDQMAIPDPQDAPSVEVADAGNTVAPPAPQGAIPDDVPVPTPRPDYKGAVDDTDTSKEKDDRYNTNEQLKDLDPKNPYDRGRIAVLKGLQASMKGMEETAIDDPETQRIHEAYIKGYGAAPAQIMKQVMDKIDPERKMEPGERNMLAMGSVYKYYMDKGDPAQAQEAAKSMIQYYRRQSQQYLALGKAAASHGDYDNATKAAIAAYANIPNGRDLKVEKGEDGNLTIHVTNAETGEEVTRKVMKPEEFAAAAMQMHPGNFDDEILNAAGEKAPTPPKSLDPDKKEAVDAAVGEAADAAIPGMEGAETLQPKQAQALKSIASSIAGVPENNIGSPDAVDFATRLAGVSGTDGKKPYTSKPLRGNPDYTVVAMDGQTITMPTNDFNKMEALRDNFAAAKKTAAAQAEKDKKTGVLGTDNQKLASDFGSHMGEWIKKWVGPAGNTDIGGAYGGEGGAAIADSAGAGDPMRPTPEESPYVSPKAIPDTASEAGRDAAQIKELTTQRAQLAKVAGPNNPRATQMIERIDAKLKSLGYNQ